MGLGSVCADGMEEASWLADDVVRPGPGLPQMVIVS